MPMMCALRGRDSNLSSERFSIYAMSRVPNQPRLIKHLNSATAELLYTTCDHNNGEPAREAFLL
eukprot:scaffold9162_cov157-Skeletonema_dohrnii-CCMP3373.AAC.1